jgi:hypothetical protein
MVQSEVNSVTAKKSTADERPGSLSYSDFLDGARL